MVARKRNAANSKASPTRAGWEKENEGCPEPMKVERSSLCLETLEGPCKDSVYVGKTKKNTVGRTKVNSFHIRDQTVSEKHAVFEWSGEYWTLTDIGSSNGTFVNGKAIVEGRPIPINDGYEIQFGVETKVKARIEAPVDSSKTVLQTLEEECERIVRQLELIRDGNVKKVKEGALESIEKLSIILS